MPTRKYQGQDFSIKTANAAGGRTPGQRLAICGDGRWRPPRNKGIRCRRRHLPDRPQRWPPSSRIWALRDHRPRVVCIEYMERSSISLPLCLPAFWFLPAVVCVAPKVRKAIGGCPPAWNAVRLSAPGASVTAYPENASLALAATGLTLHPMELGWS